MTYEELLLEMEKFICDQSLWVVFIQEMKAKGYSEKEIDDVIEKAQ